MTINSNSHKQYFQQFNSRYIVPQHENIRKYQTQRNMIDKRLKQSKGEQIMTLSGMNRQS